MHLKYFKDHNVVFYLSKITIKNQTQKYSTSGKRFTKRQRFNIRISTDLESIMIGLLLWDGHIEKRRDNGNSRFHYGQSASTDHHTLYFYHVFGLFSHYCAEGYKPQIRFSMRKGYVKQHNSFSFVTLSLPLFNNYRQLFYKEGVKIIPKNIGELLTYKSLAYSIMDDGSLHNKGIHLNTYGFTIKEVVNLVNVFAKKWNLICTILFHKNKPRVYILPSNLSNFNTQIITIYA